MMMRDKESEEFRKAASTVTSPTTSALQALVPLRPSPVALKKKPAVKVPACIKNVNKRPSGEGLSPNATSGGMCSSDGTYCNTSSSPAEDASNKRCRGLGETPSGPQEESSPQQLGIMAAPVASLVAYDDSDSDKESTR